MKPSPVHAGVRRRAACWMGRLSIEGLTVPQWRRALVHDVPW
jgi:hypothetical protein